MSAVFLHRLAGSALCFLALAAAARAQEKAADVGRIWESTAAPAERATEAPVVANDVPALFERGMLIDRGGFTLYIFDGDRRPNVSTCYGVCKTLWPPHHAPDGARPTGDFTVLPRRDGGFQWAWRGKPLYRWARDKKPGDVTGDNVNEVWHLVRDEN